VVIIATRWGLGPSVLASMLGVLAFDFFLIPPYLTFNVHDTQYIFTFLGFLTVGVLLSYATNRIRWQTEVAKQREHEVGTLYNLARRLATTSGREDVINAILTGAGETFGHGAVLFLPEARPNGVLKPFLENTTMTVNENVLAAATWSFAHQKIAGWGTSHLPNIPTRFLPLTTAHATVGVLALFRDELASPFNHNQLKLMDAFADLAAVAIERTALTEKARQADLLRESEKLQTALFNSISHDLRTPLVTILGALTSFEEKSLTLNEASKETLVQIAREETERLNHLITNLLDVSRLEAGAIRLAREPTDLQEIIGVALARLGNKADSQPIEVSLPGELPFVLVDSGLIAQVFVNILDNAIKYSPVGSPIEISARRLNPHEIEVKVADLGIGVPSGDLELVFDKFYRVQRPEYVSGTGLGLAIAKGIVEVHGGHIIAVNRPEGGTIILFTLPIAKEEK
jgi:two-component system, OmpR family, sensor histidine kinase KdpD